MSSRRASIALASTLGLAGLAGGAVLGPAVATAASGQVAPAIGDRVQRLQQALQGLVDDGTLTAAQRDKVASTLADKLPPPGRGPRGPRGGELDTAASALGMTPTELRAQLRAGKSLADVAKDRGVALGTLTAALQNAAADRLAQAVQDGRLTQQQADKIKATLPQRIADAVQRKGAPGPGRHLRPGTPPGPTPPGTAGGRQQPSSYTPA